MQIVDRTTTSHVHMLHISLNVFKFQIYLNNVSRVKKYSPLVIYFFFLIELNDIFLYVKMFDTRNIRVTARGKYFNDKEGIEILPKSIRRVFRTLECAIISSWTELAVVRWPNVNITMVIDPRVFGAKPKASLSLVKRYQILSCRSSYPGFGIFWGEGITNFLVPIAIFQFFPDFTGLFNPFMFEVCRLISISDIVDIASIYRVYVFDILNCLEFCTCKTLPMYAFYLSYISKSIFSKFINISKVQEELFALTVS